MVLYTYGPETAGILHDYLLPIWLHLVIRVSLVTSGLFNQFSLKHIEICTGCILYSKYSTHTALLAAR